MTFFPKFSSCKRPKETGKFYLNLYFSEGEEANSKDNKNEDFKYFKMTYVNKYDNENIKHLKGEPIAEEDEDEVKFDPKFKEALRIK